MPRISLRRVLETPKKRTPIPDVSSLIKLDAAAMAKAERERVSNILVASMTEDGRTWPRHVRDLDLACAMIRRILGFYNAARDGSATVYRTGLYETVVSEYATGFDETDKLIMRMVAMQARLGLER